MRSIQIEEIGNYIISRIGTASGRQLTNKETIRRTFPFLQEAVKDRNSHHALAAPTAKVDPDSFEYDGFDWVDGMVQLRQETFAFRLVLLSISGYNRGLGIQVERIRPLHQFGTKYLSLEIKQSQLSKTRFVFEHILQATPKFVSWDRVVGGFDVQEDKVRGP